MFLTQSPFFLIIIPNENILYPMMCAILNIYAKIVSVKSIHKLELNVN